jgi:hypothetical protein
VIGNYSHRDCLRLRASLVCTLLVSKYKHSYNSFWGKNKIVKYTLVLLNSSPTYQPTRFYLIPRNMLTLWEFVLNPSNAANLSIKFILMWYPNTHKGKEIGYMHPTLGTTWCRCYIPGGASITVVQRNSLTLVMRRRLEIRNFPNGFNWRVLWVLC